MRHIFPSFLLLLILVCPGMPVFATGAAAPSAGISADEQKELGLVPHKALYDIKLSGLKSGSQIVNISGQMLYEWQLSCDGWVANHRFNLLYEYADSEPMRITSDFSTFETFDGKTLNFTSQRKKDGELFEEFRGNAMLDENSKGEADYSLPNGLDFKLAQGSMFPMMHTLNLLKAIKEGKKFFGANVFDGADGDGPVEINAVIGKAVDASSLIKPSKNIDPTLLSSPAHAVRLAFFPQKDDSPTADYEMNINLHDNGVVSDMFIDYSDFSVTQKLVALEPIKSGCSAKKDK